MSTLEPISVALKYGFLVVLYLFLLWVAWSATRELRGARAQRGAPGAFEGMLAPGTVAAPDATGMHSASTLAPVDVLRHAPRLVVERAPSHDPGMIYDLDGDALLGRGDRAEIRLEDPFASSAHARIFEQGGILAVEDLGSTNGTYLNEELLESPRPLHPGDRLRIGDSEFTFEVD
ncbi:MAG: FHA domain-containing protein [Solirubrobacteraceae bacterium]